MEAVSHRLEDRVTRLAGEIGERNVFRPRALAAAAQLIQEEWQGQGYSVDIQTYRTWDQECANLSVTRQGRGHPEQLLLIGAHYDSVRGSPGANDNGSGVATLLELSRAFVEQTTELSLRFVAFVNEEPPFFPTDGMGSMVYARAARRRGDDILGMLSLETIGFYSDAPGSQNYPPLYRFFYPDRGDFVAFVSNLRSRDWLRRVVAAFRAHSSFPVQSAAALSIVPGVGWSDHQSFWRQGYPALMVTDTAPYRYPYYHSAEDTPDKLDYDRLAQLADGLFHMLKTLSQVAS